MGDRLHPSPAKLFCRVSTKLFDGIFAGTARTLFSFSAHQPWQVARTLARDPPKHSKRPEDPLLMLARLPSVRLVPGASARLHSRRCDLCWHVLQLRASRIRSCAWVPFHLQGWARSAAPIDMMRQAGVPREPLFTSYRMFWVLDFFIHPASALCARMCGDGKNAQDLAK